MVVVVGFWLLANSTKWQIGSQIFNTQPDSCRVSTLNCQLSIVNCQLIKFCLFSTFLILYLIVVIHVLIKIHPNTAG